MKKLNFSFSTKLTFDNYVHDHSFALRCIPIESAAQKIISCDLEVSPFTSTQATVDAFGNNVVSGFIRKDHRLLDFEINGCAEIDSSVPKTDYMPCYLYQSAYTKPGEALNAFYDELCGELEGKTADEKAVLISDKLSEVFAYEKGVTDTKTTAEAAFVLKKGVCQDYSHIMISLLRTCGIAARYIAGLACCDGETHSWLEYWDGEKWKGFDPANNCPVTDDYLVLSQGRDFGDCAVDRGVMFGAYTRQMQLISSSLTTAF